MQSVPTYIPAFYFQAKCRIRFVVYKSIPREIELGRLRKFIHLCAVPYILFANIFIYIYISFVKFVWEYLRSRLDEMLDMTVIHTSSFLLRYLVSFSHVSECCETKLLSETCFACWLGFVSCNNYFEVHLIYLQQMTNFRSQFTFVFYLTFCKICYLFDWIQIFYSTKCKQHWITCCTFFFSEIYGRLDAF